MLEMICLQRMPGSRRKDMPCWGHPVLQTHPHPGQGSQVVALQPESLLLGTQGRASSLSSCPLACSAAQGCTVDSGNMLGFGQ